MKMKQFAKAVDDLFKAQTGDFLGMFKAMDGYPVIVRLLDPPLHEFLESARSLDVEIAVSKHLAAIRMYREEASAYGADRRHERAESYVGSSWLPFGNKVPYSSEMQVRAIATAAAQLKKEGFDPEA